MIRVLISNQICASFVGMVLVAVLLGLVGTMVVQSKMAFFSDALGHCVFTGVAIGNVLGIQNYRISVVLFAVIFAVLISLLIEKEKSSADTVISVFSSAGLASGIFVLSLNKETSSYSDFFVGDILSISQNEIIGLLVLLLAVLIFWFMMFNKFILSSLNKDLASSKLVNFKFYKMLFTIMLSIVVSIAVRWVGILLINSLLILPAATSRNFAKNIRQYIFFSILFSIFSGVFGFTLSYIFGGASTPLIVILATICYLISHFVSNDNFRKRCCF